MKRIPLLIFIFFAFYQNIFSQNDFRKGYIITEETDSIIGFINYRENNSKYKYCYFKSSEDKEVSKFDADQILEYGFLNDKVFLSNEVVKEDHTKEKVFLEILVRGNTSFYGYLDVFYIKKGDDKIHELSNEKVLIDKEGKKYYKNTNKHISVLSYLLSDCKSLKEKINNVGYSERQLTKLIELYNECSGEQSITFKEEKPWLKTQIGLMIGLNSSQLNFSSNNNNNTDHLNNFNRENSFMPGIFLDFSSPRLNEKTFINLGLFYLSSTYTSYTKIKSSLTTDYNDVIIEVEQLKIPLSFKYMFPKKNFTPFINIGGAYTFHLSSNSIWIQEREVNNQVITYEKEPVEVGSGQLSFFGGIGVKKSIGNKLSGIFELRLEQSSGVAVEKPDLYGKNTLTNFQFLIGISY